MTRMTINQGFRLAMALELLAILPGCGVFKPQQEAAAPAATGNALLVVPLGALPRTVQYVSTDINAAKVSILDAGNANALVAAGSYTGASLAAHLVAGKFTFLVSNLVVNDGAHPAGFSYNARVDAYLDSAETTNIGSTTTSAPFTVTANSTFQITNFPSLALIATPVGSATATSSNAVTIVDNAPAAVTFK